MAKTEAKTTETTYARQRKANLEIRRFKDKNGNVINKSIIGLYWRSFNRPQEVVTDSGEVVDKDLVTMVLIDPKTGERFGIFQDGGLRNAMVDVQPGDFIEIEYTGQQALDKGRKCNMYDVYQLEKPAGLKLPETTAPLAARGGELTGAQLRSANA